MRKICNFTLLKTYSNHYLKVVLTLKAQFEIFF